MFSPNPAPSVTGTLDYNKGVDLPLALVFAGVVAGLMTPRLIGIFVRPVVLAAAHTLFEAWAADAEEGGELATAPPRRAFSGS